MMKKMTNRFAFLQFPKTARKQLFFNSPFSFYLACMTADFDRGNKLKII